MLGLGWKPFSEYEEKQIIEAIAEAEKATSGEVRVHIDKWCKTDPLFKAQNIFQHLGMEKTKQRNGVLVYVALKEHKFAIVGDEGIDRIVSRVFWESTKEKMSEAFSKGEVVEGICAGIKEAGLKLKAHFPYQSDDENELPDEITHG